MHLHNFCLIQFRHDVFLSFKFEDIPPPPSGYTHIFFKFSTSFLCFYIILCLV
ncbi:hypothetical protein HanHA300_Chr12g0439451 [Helianthus annuus]|nr:hypothetical protein HanHA300_Chr12g0439451 [Helianthus annuus]KAJ0504913.1 hypothetical protein HanHA89_Chr12g0464571 [Helianthus annuus]